MMTKTSGALTLVLCLFSDPGLAATCHMTVQGMPVIGDRECSSFGRSGDVRIAVGADTIRIRRSTMTGRFAVQRSMADGRPRRIAVNYGLVVVSTDSDDRTCYFNQKATLCVDP